MDNIELFTAFLWIVATILSEIVVEHQGEMSLSTNYVHPRIVLLLVCGNVDDTVGKTR